MATSPGQGLSVAIKPLLSASYSSFNKNDLPELTKGIQNSEKEILEHDDDYEPFYSSLVALSAHFLSATSNSLTKTTLTQASNASRVLLRFMLLRLQKHNESCTISQKYLMILIKGLCNGGGCLPKADVVTFASMLKSAKRPPNVTDSETTEQDETKPKEVKRPRLDTGNNLFDQLTSVFDEIGAGNVPKVEPQVETVSTEGDATVVPHVADSTEEMTVLFAKKNTAHLLQLNGANILVDTCFQLTFLGKYIQRYKDAVAGKTFLMPGTLSEALTTRNSYQSLLSDVSIVWRAFSLPSLEPLTPKRLEKIVIATLSCLYASVTVAMANTIVNMVKPTPANQPAAAKDEEIEGYGTNIVQKTLEIFNCVSTAVRNSTRAGGSVAQNLNLLAAWVLLKGLQGILGLTPAMILERKDTRQSKSADSGPKGKESSSPSGRPSSGRSSFQGFGVLSVALGSNAVQLLTTLFEDLQIEGSLGDLKTMPGEVKPGMDVTILTSASAWKRVKKLVARINLTDMLLSLVVVTFKKAAMLKRLKQGSESSETSSSSTSDSNTFYEDDFSSSEESSEEEDEDSEPILGHWFEETLSPEEPSDATPPPPLPPRVEGSGESKRNRHPSNGDKPNFVPDKREPDGFVALATNVLNFINVYMVNSTDAEIKKLMRTSLNEEHVGNLAILIRELDKECAKVGNADKVYEDISVALAKLNHSLIATGCLSDNLQDVLLVQLGVSPNSVDPWPLTVYPRTLAVLAEVLLLKQQKEREAKTIKSQSDNAVINIWVRFIVTLKTAILNFDNKTEQFEDVNVEHMQLLLFLFHSLQLMQKKSLLLRIAECVVTLANMEKDKLETMVPLPLSRVMLILDYLLHYFYDPPSAFIDQVQWNLFTVHTLTQTGDRETGVISKASQFFPCREVEENFRKNLTTQETAEVGHMKPRFYSLGPGEINNQDSPKIDGLASNFLLSNPETLNYNQMYDACIGLLMAGSRCDKTKDKLSLLDASAMHYHFLILWRLLACLPPSVQYIKLLESSQLNMSKGHVLHTLRWAPRLGHKAFISWVKDWLVKQGLTTQQAETLLTSANKTANCINYDVRLAMNFIQDQIVQLPLVGQKEILPMKDLPGLSAILMLDAVVAKVEVGLDDAFSKAMADTDPHKTMDIAQDLIPAILLLVEAYSVYVRSCVLGDVASTDETTLTPHRLQAFGAVMSIGSSRASKVSVLGSEVMAILPSPVRNAVEKWNNTSGNEFPSIGAWRNAFANDILPCESYMDTVHSAHMVTLSGQPSFCINASMRHVLNSLVRFASDLVVWCPDSGSSQEFVRVMFPLMYDITTEYIADSVSGSLEKFLGASDGEEFALKMYRHVISVCHELIIDYSDTESGLDEKILQDCLKFMENHLEKTAGKKAFEQFYTDRADLTSLLLSLVRDNLSPQFATKVLKFFNKLFHLAEKSPGDKSYETLCASLSTLASVDKVILQNLLAKVITKPEESEENESNVKENRILLQNLTMFIVKEKSPIGEEVSQAVLAALIPMGGPLLTDQERDMSGFPELMVIMNMLAGAGQGAGHVVLFQAATSWLNLCKSYLEKKDVLEKVLKNGSSGKGILQTMCCLLTYVGDILCALKKTSERSGTATPPLDSEIVTSHDADSDWTEELNQEDEDSGAEDSDDESLNNKLCTFTITQKEFMNQHWYHCHTCKMVDGVGVCTVCAKVCHKDHDLTYAKFGSFFCDCGAKEDGSCKALVKRTAQSGLDCSTSGAAQSPFSMDTVQPSSLRRRLSSPSIDEKASEMMKTTEMTNKAREALCRQIEYCRETLLSQMENSDTVKTVLEMLEKILPPLIENYQDMSPMGSTARAQRALQELHTMSKKVEPTSEQLMTVTLGSQEGAFENVRMNYSGDQGQTIRQLITAHVLRRVAMCVLSSPHGKRQHLAISHEKGKITILQLSALLKQADSSKKKLTLTRLSSAPIPFTVLSITGNPCNEDFLAVCGLKDCHVLTFTSSGSVADHLVLHPSLATGNFIIKAIWLPGSQTELAVVTADFVKIYDLGLDAISPQYYFLLPSGKIRDATFVYTEEGCYIVLMSSTGYIYTQLMEDCSSAVHGPFYITNVLEVKHADLKDNNGQVAGGGVSVYYSHALQLLFFSYTQGKSFIAPVAKDLSQVSNLFPISFKSSNGGGKGGNNYQPLVQWSEVSGHTGLLYCMAQTSNNPVVLMVKPDTIHMQEIKVVPAKAKIQDVVAIRHIASNTDQQRTTMILLCEDGSLRIYMANVDNTNYWLSPYLQPQSPISVLKPAKKKKSSKSGRPAGLVTFPIDFFEHCQQTNDIEFGGNDVLQIYNVQQVKHRLNTTGMYIASTKPAGFTLEINNTNNTTVMVGVRVLVGSQSIERAPSYLEVFGRTTQVNVNRARWIDMAFTREESLTADKKFSLFVGASVDPAGVTMMDSVKVYVKTKEAFGWPEETDEFPETTAPKITPSVPTAPSTETDTVQAVPLPLTTADKLLSSALEVLEGAFAAGKIEEKDPSRDKALDLATSLLTLPTPPTVQQHTKSLLASLFVNKPTYHNHKDQAQLVHVMKSLSRESTDMDVEAFQRLVVTARSVAVARPANLLKFAEKGDSKEETMEVLDLEYEKEEKSEASPPSSLKCHELEVKDYCHFTTQLVEAFWKLHTAKPTNSMLAPVCLPGLAHVDATVGAVVEIIHAFTVCDAESVNLATKHYVKLLLSTDPVVSFACRQALIRALRPRHRRRRVFIPSPPRCSSPGGPGGDDDDDDDSKPDKPDTPPPAEAQISNHVEHQDEDPEGDDQFDVVESNEPMVLEPGEGNAQGNHLSGLEALYGFDRNFELPADADDEAMVELAIALSLQEQGGGAGGLSLQSLGLARQGQSASSIEEGPLSDTTASAPGSDDEVGSNAATEGSTLRTSPAEQPGSAGSESGGSAVDSVSVSGRSSAYGYTVPEGGTTARSETSSIGGPTGSMHHEVDVMETDADYDASCRLHSLRLQLLERLLQYLPEIRDVGGVRAIPFMQVLLMLTSDLDNDEEKDRAALDNLLQIILQELDLSGQGLDNIETRTRQFEVKLILLRLLSVLLSRTRAGTKPSSECLSFVSNCTATSLLSTGAIEYCMQVLKNLLPYWKNYSTPEEEGSTTPGQLLKPHPSSPPPDMSPFFLRQYVKGHANDVFEDYPQLLTEMVLRLPYQLKKIADTVQSVPKASFEPQWHSVLSEYMMTQQTPFVKRQARKLLLFICGSKDKYRQLRDMHAIESNLQSVVDICEKGGLDVGAEIIPHGVILPYDTLLTMIEHLKVCCEIAASRPFNWQTYCEQAQDTLPFLVKASISLDEGVAPTLLQLLQSALCGLKLSPNQTASSSSSSSTSPVKQKKDKNKNKNEEECEECQKFDETLCISLVKLLNRVLDRGLFIKFIRTFLLESNSSGNRWLAHSLVLQIYRNTTVEEQETLLSIMWELWTELPVYGRKAAQFVDLLGYFVLKTPDLPDKRIREYLEKAVSVLREENQVLANHPNATIYNMLQGLVDFDGYYLESDPCLVCNNPEVPYSSLKLSAIKVDSKFTTTTQIVKLVGSHNISKISLRISDLKRTKMVRSLNIYYNNRSVQAVVELKNRPGLWHKAKKVTLTAGQTDVKVEFPIPIVACNLMIEYADFFDNLQATAETLQCPRCSASVPANPGVCGNCGENVFQCHKCRAINYDEKDPFLCNACGFCKYAKFEFTLTAKPCCAVDPIESEDDRKKAISTINSLLEKADKIYKTLQSHRPVLENLLIQVTEHNVDRVGEVQSSGSGGGVPASSVNKAIQMLAQKYCVECKTSFDELSKIIQKVLACRRELVEYDRQQREAVAVKGQEMFLGRQDSKAKEVESCMAAAPRREKEVPRPTNCYGCASSAVEHCITLLRALVTNSNMRQILCSQGMIQQLIDYNLRHGTLPVRNEVRSLLCLLTKDNRRGTEEMNNLIMTRITAAIKGHQSNPDLGSSVRHEILLLASSLNQDDSCWEQRVRCVMRLFLMGMHIKSPTIMESITLPCLRILQSLVKNDGVIFKKKEDGEAEISENLLPAKFHMDVKQWLAGDPRYSYSQWKKRLPRRGAVEEGETKKDEEKKMVRARYLMEKYGTRWQQKMWRTPAITLKLTQNTWLQQAMFSPSSRSARQTACSIIEAIAQVPSRRKEVMDMITGCLDEVGKSGECASDFLALYKRLISPDHWKFYLAIKGVLLHLGDLITKEVEHLEYLEETTLSSDLAQGFALKSLTELLSTFVEQESLKQHYKNRLVGYILNGYLSLRKLVVQRTKLIDETQEKLLELLEELTTGTDSETKEFMSVCVQTVKKYPLKDNRSPVFIFERLCSIIFPEENDVTEFFMILEKDPQQEDFLQGRMLGNPYSCNEPGMGPLMRDIKNKICQDCELVALLEDDTGMELLVNKKIISLDLPVKEVYKKIWLPEHGEGEPMPIIYRMRGLLGDATEDMVNSFDSSSEEDIDKEEVFKMAAVLTENGGLEVMLERLSSVKDLVLGKQLMVVLLKLFGFAVNVKVNRQELIKPELNTINIMLGALNLALWSEQEAGVSATKGQTITEQVLQIMEVILLEASQQPPEKYTEFSKLCGDKEQLMMLLGRINSPFVRANSTVLQALMRLIPFLAFGEDDKMLALLNHFKQYLDFNKFDFEHSQDEQVHLDCFCVIASGIESNANGIRLKNLILQDGVVQSSVDYILMHAPAIKTLLATDSEVWKEFISKPSLSYTLRLLTGLCTKHKPTQDLIAENCIPILHKLEQVSSDKHIGTLAENLLDALKSNESAARKIEEIRQQTKAEKKRLAMAVRKKHLGALGMTTNEKGQVTVKSTVLKQMEDLKEETGLTCCICREGYRYQPQKVLAVYTFTKRTNLDEFENKSRKSVGYTTVSHFNVIHVECHAAAVRHARGREEWESAALQNANTKCNGLLPMWGPQVQESVFATCLARHNNYLQECTGIRDPSHLYTIHDIKLLLLRFAQEKSFSDESGGGGRQSNMHLVPYMIHMALYVVNTTRSMTRDEKSVQTFLELPKEKWVENSFEADGPMYYPVLSILVHSPEKWQQNRVKYLERVLVMAHCRSVCQIGAKTLIVPYPLHKMFQAIETGLTFPSPFYTMPLHHFKLMFMLAPVPVNEKTPKEYGVYKNALIFYGFLVSIYDKILKKVNQGNEGTWSNHLAEYIRHNDKLVLENCDRIIRFYEEEMLPCESLAELCDVIGLLEDIPNPDDFLKDLLASLP